MGSGLRAFGCEDGLLFGIGEGVGNGLCCAIEAQIWKAVQAEGLVRVVTGLNGMLAELANPSGR